MRINIKKSLKHNIVAETIYEKILKLKCRNVEAYVFVGSTGRSGSKSLTKIFNAVDDSISLHEPYPIMYNDIPPNVDKNEYFEYLFNKYKVFYIQRAASKYRYYLETNHQFIKNFIDPAVKYFKSKLKVIHLVRDPVSVGASFYQIGSIPGKTERGKTYLIDPKEKSNIINIADILFENEEFCHDLYKCLWYWYEIEAKIKAAKIKYPYIKFHQIKTNDLNDENELLKMFRSLNIFVNKKKLKELVGTRSNIRKNEKKKTVNIEKIKEMDKKLCRIMENRYGKNFWL